MIRQNSDTLINQELEELQSMVAVLNQLENRDLMIWEIDRRLTVITREQQRRKCGGGAGDDYDDICAVDMEMSADDDMSDMECSFDTDL